MIGVFLLHNDAAPMPTAVAICSLLLIVTATAAFCFCCLTISIIGESDRDTERWKVMYDATSILSSKVTLSM
jgi:hypothetical protein